ncbi:MAG: ABC transporter substrate-binding protein, partial [Acidobacteriota bacterium]
DGGAVALIGGVTPGEARSLAGAADAQERVMILTSATEQNLSRDSKWVYRLAASDAEAGATFATFAARRFKTRTAAILASDAAYASAVETGFEPTFTSLEGELVATLHTDAGALEATVGELVALAPDLAVLSGDAEWQRAAADELRGQGYRGHLFASRHLVHPGVTADVAPIKDLLFAHSGFDPSAQREGLQGFLDGYTTLNGSAPDAVTAQVSAEAWDALQVLHLALRDRPAMASEVRRGLRDQVKSFPGASGSLEFDDTGSVTTFPRVFSLNAEGGLRDHGAFLDQKEERIAEERRALKERLQNLQSQMRQGAGG